MRFGALLERQQPTHHPLKGNDMDTFKFPWRLETRASLLHPWQRVGQHSSLESALDAYRRYSPRFACIRAN